MYFLRCLCFVVLFVCAAGYGKPAESVDLEIGRGVNGDSVLHLRFSTMAGIRYELHESDDLVEWGNSVATLVGNGADQEFAVPTVKSAQFFKVVAALHDSIVSSITGIEYPIHVYVPAGYEDSSMDYPIIYATDGQWITEGYSSAIESKGKEVILVTIEQGPGNRRAIDYLVPGSTNYFQFLITELLPAVESLYRIDSSRRSICGTSYGGLLVGSLLLMDNVDTPYFENYLCFDGSFWESRSGVAALERARFSASQEMDVTLFLSSATGVPNNDSWVTQFKNTLEARNYTGLRIIRKSYPVTHNQVGQPSFEEALDILF